MPCSIYILGANCSYQAKCGYNSHKAAVLVISQSSFLNGNSLSVKGSDRQLGLLGQLIFTVSSNDHLKLLLCAPSNGYPPNVRA